MKTGIELIAEERQEQITKHYRTVDRDVEENDSDNEIGCSPLILGAIAIIRAEDSEAPARWDLTIVQRMVDKPYKERLVIAGALIAAEIDRINSLTNPDK